MRMVAPEFSITITYGVFEDGEIGVDWDTPEEVPPVILLGMLESVKQCVSLSGMEWDEDEEDYPYGDEAGC